MPPAGLVLAVAGGGILLSIFSLYYLRKQRLDRNSAVTPDEFHALQATKHDGSNIFDVLPKDRETLAETPLTFFRYSTCPFCGKLKAFLDIYGLNYTVVEVEPMLKSQISGNGYGKVPQLRVGLDGPILVDSEKIVEILSKVMKVDCASQQVQFWRDFAAQKLVRHLVVVLNSSLSEALKGFDYIDDHPDIPKWNKVFLKCVGGPVMYLVAQTVTKKRLVQIYTEEVHALSSETGELERATHLQPAAALGKAGLEAQLRNWIVFGLNGRSFHGGSTPDGADIDVYGVLQSIRGHHLYSDILQDAQLSAWVSRMDACADSHSLK